MWKTLHGWLGLSEATPAPEPAPLRELLNALDRLEPKRAQFLARFAFLLGRVARVDERFSDEEARAMEIMLVEQAHLPGGHAMLVVNLAKTSKQMFSSMTDFTVTQEFADTASYQERLALAHCMFAVAGSDERISTTEEAELHRITNQLRIEGPDLRKIRMLYRPMLPGLGPES
ncbi:MAG TPA: TerB family tellurite resistance protein [Vicinamibacterales bacterium]|nr:TerB family tellurite resistance protein [Vicinamibacterales bacterium]